MNLVINDNINYNSITKKCNVLSIAKEFANLKNSRSSFPFLQNEEDNNFTRSHKVRLTILRADEHPNSFYLTGDQGNKDSELNRHLAHIAETAGKTARYVTEFFLSSDAGYPHAELQVQVLQDNQEKPLNIMSSDPVITVDAQNPKRIVITREFNSPILIGLENREIGILHHQYSYVYQNENISPCNDNSSSFIPNLKKEKSFLQQFWDLLSALFRCFSFCCK